MKRIHSWSRTFLMAFTLGLAAVYMFNGLKWNEVAVELPTAASKKVLFVFPDNSRILTREKNCGKDPRDARARLECENERLLGSRDMGLYADYDVTCDYSRSDNYFDICGRKLRNLIWQNWREKIRAHVVVNYPGVSWRHEDHYFVEPSGNNGWQLVSNSKRYASFLVDGRETWVGIVDFPWAYARAQWKIATENEGPYHLRPGTRYLEFSNTTDDTIKF